MRGMILVLGLILLLTVGVYTYFRLKRMASFYKLDADKKPLKFLIIVFACIIAMFSMNILSTASVVLLHMLAVSVLLDVIAFMVGRITRQQGKTTAGIWRKVYECGMIPILLATVITVYGFYNISHVVETHYTVEAKKEIREGGYRIALLTDIHYATIQNPEVLKKKIDEINEAKADIVVLGGDIVEEGTTKEEMQEVFRLLGGIHNQFGVYYVYGNHDRQPYTNDRTFTNEELDSAIIESGIQILKDAYITIGNDIILVGRDDAAWGNTSGRVSAEEILSGVDEDKYIVMLDHQPIEAEENNALGVDLQLSGHTHAGQIWPVGPLTELMGALNYGQYEVGNCHVIVSSGVAGWRYPMRTGEHSEYVIIDIK